MFACLCNGIKTSGKVSTSILSKDVVHTKKKYCLFPVTVRKKGEVGRQFFSLFFGQKCVLYACFTLIWSWMGEKNFRVGIFLNKNLLGLGYRKQTTFSFRPH